MNCKIIMVKKILLFLFVISIISVACNTQADNAYTYNRRGAIIDSIEIYKKTIADCNREIEKNASDTDAYYYRGYAKYYLQDYDGTIADFNKVIELNPKDSECYNMRGISKKALHDYIGAIADYSKAIEINPNYEDAYYNRGDAKNDLKKSFMIYFHLIICKDTSANCNNQLNAYKLWLLSLGQ